MTTNAVLSSSLTESTPIDSTTNASPATAATHTSSTEAKTISTPTTSSTNMTPLPSVVEVVIRTTNGTEIQVNLSRLSDLEKQELSDLAGDDELNLDDLESKDFRIPRARELVEKAVGHPIAWGRGEKLCKTDGTFLQKYEITEEDRDRVSTKNPITQNPTTLTEKIATHKRYKCGEKLFAVTHQHLQRKRQKLQTELDQIPPPPVPIRTKLKSRKETIERELRKLEGDYKNPDEWHAKALKKQMVLTEALLPPLDLTGKTDTQIRQELETRQSAIKGILDQHARRNWPWPFEKDNPQKEPSEERESEWVIFTSNTSKFETVRQEIAKDVALSPLACQDRALYHYFDGNKVIGPELIYIQLQTLAAKGASSQEIRNALDSDLFSEAFQGLDATDSKELKEELFREAVFLSTFCQNLSVANDPDAATFRKNFDATFDAPPPASPIAPAPITATPTATVAPAVAPSPIAAPTAAPSPSPSIATTGPTASPVTTPTPDPESIPPTVETPTPFVPLYAPTTGYPSSAAAEIASHSKSTTSNTPKKSISLSEMD